MGIQERHILCLCFTFIIMSGISFAQQEFIDPQKKKLFDSLDLRINQLQSEIPVIIKTKDVSYYYKKRELDLTLFIKAYEEYIFEEDLDMAGKLTLKQLNDAKKRRDVYSIEILEQYAKRLEKEKREQLNRYNTLFAKEKNFKKEFNSYLSVGDRYALYRAKRMTELALKYARQQNIQQVLEYLPCYLDYINAVIYDYHSEFDLKSLTRSESQFQKEFIPLISSDSLSHILKAGELVTHCYHYASSSKSVLDTNYFTLQQNAVKTSVSDYYERQGISGELSKLTGQSVIARLDTLNREGIYKWHDKIIVIGTLKPRAKFDNVKKGEAIIHADKKLFKYIRVNKIMRLKNQIKLGKTFLIPYTIEDEKNNFHFNRENMQWQYIVCYTQIINPYTTREISKFLPPMMFREEEDYR